MRRDVAVLLCFLSGCSCGPSYSTGPAFSTGCAPLAHYGAPDGSIPSSVDPTMTVTISGAVALLPGTLPGAVQVYRGGVDEYGTSCSFPDFPSSPFLSASVDPSGSYSFELHGADAIIQLVPDGGANLDGGTEDDDGGPADASTDGTELLDAGLAPDEDDAGLAETDGGIAPAPDAGDIADGGDAGLDLTPGDGGVDLGVPAQPTEAARCFRVFYEPADAGPSTWIDFPVVQQQEGLDMLSIWDVTPTTVDEGGALEIDWSPSPLSATVVVSDTTGTLWEEVQPVNAARWLLPKYLAGSDDTVVQLVIGMPSLLTPEAELGMGSGVIDIGALGSASLLATDQCVSRGDSVSPCPYTTGEGGGGPQSGGITFSLVQPTLPGHLILTGLNADSLVVSTSTDGMSFTPAASEDEPPQFLDVDLTDQPAIVAVRLYGSGLWQLQTARLTP